MKRILIKPLNEEFQLKSLNKIQIENTVLYRELCLNTINDFIYTEDEKEYDLNKNGLVLINPYYLELNDKKIISALYKKIERLLNEEEKESIRAIERNLLEILSNISVDLDTPIDYDENVEFSKLLSSINVRIKEPEEKEYLDILIAYIKAYQELYKTKLIITFALSYVLTDSELTMLEKELQYNELVLIDIIPLRKMEDTLCIIDKDWCIL